MALSDLDISDYCIVPHEGGSGSELPQSPPPHIQLPETEEHKHQDTTPNVSDIGTISDLGDLGDQGSPFPDIPFSVTLRLQRSTSDPNPLPADAIKRISESTMMSSINGAPPPVEYKIEYKDRIIYKYIYRDPPKTQPERFLEYTLYDVGVFFLSLLASFGIGRVIGRVMAAPVPRIP